MNSKIDFIYLNEQEMLNAGVKDMARCVAAMEDMFKLVDIGDYRMGGDNANEHGIRVSFPKTTDIDGMPVAEPDKRFMAMPAYLGGKFHMFGIKTYGSNPHNVEKGLPRSILMMSMMDATTGAPLAYMSANILSAMRTAAVTALGAKYGCNPNPESVAIIGPGVMGRYALDAFVCVQPTINTVKIKGRGQANIDRFMEMCKEKYPQIKTITVCDSIREACADTDIIYYGTTNAAKYEDNPSIEKEWVKEGAVVISASALLVKTDFLADSNTKILADNYLMYEGWGAGHELPTQKNVSTLLGMGFYDAVCEGKIDKNAITNIGEILNGKKIARDNKKQVVLYAVGGLPIEDVAWGYECLLEAKKKNIGTKLNLWDVPELMK